VANLLSTGEEAERAVLVGIDCAARGARRPPDPTTHPDCTAEESLEELSLLAASAGAAVLDVVMPDTARTGCRHTIGSARSRTGPPDQSPGRWSRPVRPRAHPDSVAESGTGASSAGGRPPQLILDIFARRPGAGKAATSGAGATQLSVARLTGRGVEMSRLGGVSARAAPGETQLETDRRRIYRRIRKIERDVEAVRGSRSTQRKQRQAVRATVALVGYTNAGKSTLFNRLTGAEVTADARMFATLDRQCARSLCHPEGACC